MTSYGFKILTGLMTMFFDKLFEICPRGNLFLRSFVQRCERINGKLTIIRIIITNVCPKRNIIPFTVNNIQENGNSNEKFIKIELLTYPTNDTGYGIDCLHAGAVSL